MSRIHAHTIHIDFRLLGSIHSRHHDVGIEALARIKRSLLRNHKGIKFVDANILHIYIRNEGMEHLSFRIAHITLQFGEQSDSSSHRHILKHIFLPVFAQSR